MPRLRHFAAVAIMSAAILSGPANGWAAGPPPLPPLPPPTDTPPPYPPGGQGIPDTGTIMKIEIKTGTTADNLPDTAQIDPGRRLGQRQLRLAR